MKVMCDTNIFLDVLLDREPFFDYSARVLRLCESGQIDGFVTAACVTDIFYIVHSNLHSNEAAYHALGKVLEIVNVCDVTALNVLEAFHQKKSDFEDCLVAICAKSIGCDYLITRNLKDFAGLPMDAITPKEFINDVFERSVYDE